MAKVKCKRCGRIMNIPRGHADLCYECTWEDPKREVVLDKGITLKW